MAGGELVWVEWETESSYKENTSSPEWDRSGVAEDVRFASVVGTWLAAVPVPAPTVDFCDPAPGARLAQTCPQAVEWTANSGTARDDLRSLGVWKVSPARSWQQARSCM